MLTAATPAMLSPISGRIICDAFFDRILALFIAADARRLVSYISAAIYHPTSRCCRTATTSLSTAIMDTFSSSSHTPRTIFPDIPASRRAATISPGFVAETVPGPPPNTRRHTTQFLPTRREARPLRSSPLAGPSLALSQDGTLKPEAEKKLLSSDFTMPSEAFVAGAISESPPNDLASPTSECSSSGHALSAPEPHTPTELLLDGSISSRIRRLSLGFKRRPSSGLPAQSNPSDAPPPRTRRLSSSSSHSHAVENAPPVPELPQWAREVEKRSATFPPSPTQSQDHRRRPSTSPSTASSASASTRRQSVFNSQLPSTSRNPEENWMTSASAPRFSRLGLKGDGVVMPVSLKEARRRSTASLSSRMGASDAPSVKGKQSTRSLRTVHPSSETAKRLAEDAEMLPPRPLFVDVNGSSSSLGSSVTDTDSIMTEARSISRISSMTDGELPLPHGHTAEGKSSSTLELRINDVTIDMINCEQTRHTQHAQHVESPRSFAEMELSTINEVETQGAKGDAKVREIPAPTKIKRSATLKKVWKRVVRSVTG
ncbi:hypothetical protein BDY19DRAFT_400336 [Irpex rosettiformis]|uniref:Uncharacterized protein n=1 Tax=Irpex rosettiformis TaxID=378272 RepID=A0ACB8UFE3_9APHY|nr:hypothetical protein BDY19DRAFT_400336 [Irpex rosettiformis]